MATTDSEGPLIETTYPGQPKATVVAPRHIVDHLAQKGDLPFIEPVGRFKEALDAHRQAAREHQEMLDRDEGPATQ
jgi:hypothetical protein